MIIAQIALGERRWEELGEGGKRRKDHECKSRRDHRLGGHEVEISMRKINHTEVPESSSTIQGLKKALAE